MNEFIAYIKRFIEISDAMENSIKERALVEKFPKGHILLKDGKICNRLYFLADGTVRTYFYQKGRDITYWIYPENILFTSWNSYVRQQPCTDYMETTEEATLVSLSYKQWQELYTKYPVLDRFARKILEEQIAMLDDFYKGYYLLTAKEKYDLLIKAFPNITQRVNLGHIASMLGISQETLSRVRGK